MRQEIYRLPTPVFRPTVEQSLPPLLLPFESLLSGRTQSIHRKWITFLVRIMVPYDGFTVMQGVGE